MGESANVEECCGFQETVTKKVKEAKIEQVWKVLLKQRMR